MSDKVEEVKVEDEFVIGEKLSKDYIEKVDFKKSAEVRMVLYVVPVALIFIIIAFILNAAR
ncbi:MAG: hypothetical protein C0391_04750 [Anaerolinea sp.]|nr:hypothetical protein [Anaerolinea sp.]